MYLRPLLEYGTEVWHPHLVKDTLALENVQKLDLFQKWQMCYYDLLDRFKLPTLENHCLFLSLCIFFKIVHFFLLLLSLPIYHHLHFVLQIVTILLFLLLIKIILNNQLTLLFYNISYGTIYQ